MKADLRIDARWILPISDTSDILENHSIYIKDGVITALIPTEATYPEAGEHLILDQHAILPGYINAHGHAAMSLFRGLADDLSLIHI